MFQISSELTGFSRLSVLFMAMDNDQESISPNICRDHVVFAKLGYINLLLMLLCFCAAGSLEKHILSKHIQLLSSNVSSIFSV